MTGPEIAFAIGLGVAGVVVGSFVNAAMVRWVGWRVMLPQFSGLIAGAEVLKEAPALCAACRAPLSPWSDRSVSWLATGGRCRGDDRHPLARRYLVVEVLVAGLWAATGVRFGVSIVVLPVLILTASLVAMAGVDLWVMRIPNRFIYGTHAVLIPSIVIASLIEGVPGAISGAAVGGVAYFSFLFLFHLVSPRRMGFGDVRLAGVMGLVLGWLGWLENHADQANAVLDNLWVAVPLAWVIWGALIGSLLGTVLGIMSLVARRRSRPFPFGPALAIGCLAVVFFGPTLIG